MWECLQEEEEKKEDSTKEDSKLHEVDGRSLAVPPRYIRGVWQGLLDQWCSNQKIDGYDHVKLPMRHLRAEQAAAPTSSTFSHDI